ncbi:MAG: glutamate synthase subunit beta [Kiritimatiellaeota bacterium]|nr:glutamate synthase subunit beta [Kiritimatiellota bacterium]
MGKPTGFLEYERVDPPKRPKTERVRDFAEVELPLDPEQLQIQAARCMDCGIPFCHMSGCPLRNVIPDFNDMVYRGQWRRALELLHSTNNFPEITGRICPAPCEAACTLSINQPAVTIRQIERQIVERGWETGWIVPEPPAHPSGRRVAVVGSGPAGLAAAQQLTRAGHETTLFEADDRVGGTLRYGIPDFKLDKRVLDRRIAQMSAEGLRIETGVRIGEDISTHYLRRSFDAVLLAGGARTPRDLRIPGRDLKGIHFAMDFLTQQNRRNAGDALPPGTEIRADGKRVLVIGGGDTGSDCVGTALRQGAVDVVQIEIMPQPPVERSPDTPWPLWPHQLRTSSSHEEGGKRLWSVLSKEFVGENNRVAGVRAAKVEWTKAPTTGQMSFREVPGTDFLIETDLILLAMGFTKEGSAEILRGYGVEVDCAGRVVLDAAGMTTLPGVFVAGDLAAGASLVVRAIADGRRVAELIDRFLAG